MRYIVIFGFLLLELLLAAFAGNDKKEGLLRHLVGEYGQAYVVVSRYADISIEQLSIDFSISSVNDKWVELCIFPPSLEQFISKNLEYEVKEPDNSKSVVMASDLSEAMEWKSYPTYQQYEEIMGLFAENFPELCRLDTIGTSVNGKNILVLKISDNVDAEEDEAEVFYSSTMHGDELGGFVLMMRMADYMLNNYGSDIMVTTLVDSLVIYINPLANPDGVYRSGDIISSPTRSNANGVDLNRDFPDISGIAVFSPQKETEAMIAFLEKRQFVLSANFHSGAEVVNYPWDRWERRHADNDWFYSISRGYADTAHVYSLTPYMTFRDNGVTNGYDWYYTVGCRQDYITYFLGGRETTIELDNSKLTPSTDLDSLWIRNRESLLHYINNAIFGIKGVVSDSLSNKPLKARVFIVGYDQDSSHVFSDSLTGSFRRMLLPGEYEISITSDGYHPKSINVHVEESEQTQLIVELVPLGYIPEPDPDDPDQDDPDPDDPDPDDPDPDPLLSDDLELRDLLVVFPNPVGSEGRVTIYIPERLRANALDIELYNMAGTKVMSLGYHGSIESVLPCELAGLSPGIYLLVVTASETKNYEVTRLIILN